MTRPQSLAQYGDSFQQCAIFSNYLISLIINFIIVYIIRLIDTSTSILYHRHQVVMLSQGMWGGMCPQAPNITYISLSQPEHTKRGCLS